MPLSINSTNTTVFIAGSKFGFNFSDISVKVGATSCSVNHVNESSLSCVLHDLEAGSHYVIVTRRGYGLAYSKESISITSEAVVSSIEPNTGSIYGGTDVVMHGHGFHIDGMGVFLWRKGS